MEKAEYMAILKHQTMSPKEKYPLPLTSSQEYGWETAPLVIIVSFIGLDEIT
jgi:hypothetical protein